MKKIICVVLCIISSILSVSVVYANGFNLVADEIKKITFTSYPTHPTCLGETEDEKAIVQVVELLNELNMTPDNTDLSGTGGSMFVMKILYKDGLEEVISLYGNYLNREDGRYAIPYEQVEELYEVAEMISSDYAMHIKNNDTTLYLDGRLWAPFYSNVIENGRTLVSIKLVKALGAEIIFDINEKNIVIVRKNDKEIKIDYNKNKVAVNGVWQQIDAGAKLVEDVKMVPIRFVAEILGFSVEWKNEAVYISSAK